MPFPTMTVSVLKPLLGALLVLSPPSLNALAQSPEEKLAQEASARGDLARRLLAARDESERQALLNKEASLISTELARELNLLGIASRNTAKPDYPYIATAHRLAHQIAARAGDARRAGDSLVNLCNAQIEWGQYPLAMDYCNQALTWCQANSYQAGVANSLDRLGAIHDAQGDYARAQSYFADSLKILEEVGEPIGIARSLNQLGRWHYGQGNHNQALDLYQRAVGLREAIASKTPSGADNLNSLGNLYSNIGLVLTDQGNYVKALNIFEKSLATLRLINRDTGVVLGHIAAIYKRQANYRMALRYYGESLAARERRGDPLFIIPDLINLGEVHQIEGEFAQALNFYSRALVLSERIKNPKLACRAHNYIASALNEQNNSSEALAHLEKSLAFCDPHTNQADFAEANHQMALVYLARREYGRAHPFGELAYLHFSQMDYPEQIWRAAVTAGRIYSALNRMAEAREAFRSAITTIEEMRTNIAGDEAHHQIFFENKTGPYLALAELLLGETRSAEALEYAERAKARVLLDVLQHGKLNLSKAMTDAEREQERGLIRVLIGLNNQRNRESARQQPDKFRLAELSTQLEKARLDYDDFRTRLYALHTELKMQRGEVKPLTLADAAPLLPDGETALLNYVVMPERTHLFVLTKAKTGDTKLRHYPLALKREELAEKVEQFRRQLAERSARFQPLASELYVQVLKAARAELPPQSKLIIVPDGPLWELPFQALLTDRNRYLWEEHVISYAPSLTVLREMSKPRREAKEALSLFAVGDPALGGESLERARALMGGGLEQLPEARAQVEALRKFYNPNRSQVSVGAQAAEAMVKAEAGKFDILHFATHGVLNDRNPLYSYILLAQTDAAKPEAPGRQEDGLLEAWEIMQMDLQADLAVLSACETARGRVGAGEGMIGLTWAMFVAGVPSTVVSQWKVRADSTAALMVEFHRLIQIRTARGTSRWTKAEALRQAAMKLLGGGQYRHPFYWAGFVLVGKTR